MNNVQPQTPILDRQWRAVMKKMFFKANEEYRISSQRGLERRRQQIMNCSYASSDFWLISDIVSARCFVAKNQGRFSLGMDVGWKNKAISLNGEVNII